MWVAATQRPLHRFRTRFARNRHSIPAHRCCCCFCRCARSKPLLSVTALALYSLLSAAPLPDRRHSRALHSSPSGPRRDVWYRRSAGPARRHQARGQHTATHAHMERRQATHRHRTAHILQQEPNTIQVTPATNAHSATSSGEQRSAAREGVKQTRRDGGHCSLALGERRWREQSKRLERAIDQLLEGKGGAGASASFITHRATTGHCDATLCAPSRPVTGSVAMRASSRKAAAGGAPASASSAAAAASSSVAAAAAAAPSPSPSPRAPAAALDSCASFLHSLYRHLLAHTGQLAAGEVALQLGLGALTLLHYRRDELQKRLSDRSDSANASAAAAAAAGTEPEIRGVPITIMNKIFIMLSTLVRTRSSALVQHSEECDACFLLTLCCSVAVPLSLSLSMSMSMFMFAWPASSASGALCSRAAVRSRAALAVDRPAFRGGHAAQPGGLAAQPRPGAGAAAAAAAGGRSARLESGSAACVGLVR